MLTVDDFAESSEFYDPKAGLPAAPSDEPPLGVETIELRELDMQAVIPEPTALRTGSQYTYTYQYDSCRVSYSQCYD